MQASSELGGRLFPVQMPSLLIFIILLNYNFYKSVTIFKGLDLGVLDLLSYN